MDLASSRKQHWLYLDPEFYLKECALAGVSVASADPASLALHYRDYAGRFQLSPNPFFDEKRYRQLYPAVAVEVERGHFRSAFEHFKSVGIREGYSPTWFFSGAWYVARYNKLSEQELRFQGFNDPYSHYLANGIAEEFGGTWLTASVAEAKLSPDIPKSFEQLRSALTKPGGQIAWLQPIFDAAWWSAKYGGKASDSCIKTYLSGVGSKSFSPSSTFDEAFYREFYPDVAGDIEHHHFECGFHHFIQFGMVEGRKPLAVFDTNYYLSANPGVAKECQEARLPPYIHFLKNRRGRTLRLEPPFATRPCPEASGKTIFERKAMVLAELNTLQIEDSAEPAVSIILIARNMYAETIQCIQSIVSGTRCQYEIIVFDNASDDSIADLPNLFPGIKYLRVEQNLGFTIPVNQAAKLARGDIILMVNNDIEVAPGAVDRAVTRLAAEPTIGVIGGRIIRTHGMLQEAGSIVWRDGTCLGYGRDLSPHHGSVLFERDVDYCSGCFLAIRTADWQALGGFDEAYAPAYYEETDLCLRAWALGKRVVYDPKIVLWHFEYGSSKLQEDAIALMRRNQIYFKTKHRAYLETCHAPAASNIEAARLRLTKTPRLLFIEDSIPNAATGQGFVRSAYVAATLQKHMGFTTLVGLNPPANPQPVWRRRDLPATVEVRDEVTHETFDAFLEGVGGLYDYIWLSRTHNIRFLYDFIQAHPGWRRNTRIIVDTEAIASLRTMHQAKLLGVDLDVDELLAQELRGIEFADHICVVNDIDRDAVIRYLDAIGVGRPISILGHALRRQVRLSDYEDTRTILLTGSFAAHEGPNADGFRWFDSVIRPHLDIMLPSAEFVIAGFQAGKLSEHLGVTSRYTVLSDVSDMGSVYHNARVAVAPTRFAGGIPFKVHEAASHGVPMMITDLLAHQLGWANDPELAIGSLKEPLSFAKTIAVLYSNHGKWNACRENQLNKLAEQCDESQFAQTIENLLNLRGLESEVN